MLDARGPATPAYLAQHAESGTSRYVLKFEGFVLEFKGNVLKFEGNVLEFKGNVLEFEGNVLEFESAQVFCRSAFQSLNMLNLT